jgi:WD40 repeat protein
VYNDYREVLAVAELPNQQLASGGDEDNVIYVWDVRSGRCVKQLKGHAGRVSGLVALPDSRLVSASEDGSVRWWDVVKGTCIRSDKKHAASVNGITLLSDGRLCTWSDDASIRICTADPGGASSSSSSEVVLHGPDRVYCVAALGDDRIACGYDDGSVRVWFLNRNNRNQYPFLEADTSYAPHGMAVLPDGRLISTHGDGVEDYKLRVWSITLQPNGGSLACQKVILLKDLGHKVILLPDGKLALSHRDYSIHVCDLDLV